jgi:hypothetical protein
MSIERRADQGARGDRQELLMIKGQEYEPATTVAANLTYGQRGARTYLTEEYDLMRFAEGVRIHALAEVRASIVRGCLHPSAPFNFNPYYTLPRLP